MPPGRLQDKVAIITGSSSGLGRAIALAYAREGARICLADLSPKARVEVNGEEGSTTEEEVLNVLSERNGAVERHGDKNGKGVAEVMFVNTDVTKSEDWERVIGQVVGRWGRVDVLVNNAGISWESQQTHSPPLRPHLFPDSAWDTTMLVNGKSVWLGCKAAITQFLAQPPHPSGDRGWIINLSSIFGLVGAPGAPCYAASKGAVANLTRSLALDYAQDRVHVNGICPGFVRTGIFKDTTQNMDLPRQVLEDLHPFGGTGVPEDIAGPAVFLASSEAGWMTGVNLSVDGGFVAR